MTHGSIIWYVHV